MTRFQNILSTDAEEIEIADAGSRHQKAEINFETLTAARATNVPGWLVPMAQVEAAVPAASVELLPTSNPGFSQQWHLRNTVAGQFDLNVTGVWDDYTGAGVRVVVIDTGTDLTHPDLVGNLNTTLDYDYQFGDSTPAPFDPHGTAVAGIVAGANNNIGGVGVAYDAQLVTFAGYGLTSNFGGQGLAGRRRARRYRRQPQR